MIQFDGFFRYNNTCDDIIPISKLTVAMEDMVHLVRSLSYDWLLSMVFFPSYVKLPELEYIHIYAWRSYNSLRRGVHAQTHCWMCILYCFLQCFLLLDNAALGCRNNCFFEWCFLPLSICTGFYSVFPPFTLFFSPFAFSLGFYSVFRLHDVADATPRWGGGGC